MKTKKENVKAEIRLCVYEDGETSMEVNGWSRDLIPALMAALDNDNNFRELIDESMALLIKYHIKKENEKISN